MQALYVMCGIPGSGKSTLSKQVAEDNGLTRFSFDELGCHTTRQFLCPVITALQNGKSVIMDSTHLRKNERKIILQTVVDIPCHKICIYMNTPFDECLRRNAIREARLPDMMIRSMYISIQKPTLDEGWDEIITIPKEA